MKIPRPVLALIAFLFLGVVVVLTQSGSLSGVVKPSAPPTPVPTVEPTPVGPRMINLLVTGDKFRFLEDPEFKQRALERNFVVNYNVLTSLGMAERMLKKQVANVDGLWSTNDIALDKLKQYDDTVKEAQQQNQRATFFTSIKTTLPTVVVIYTWDVTAESLLKSGLVEKRGNTYYVRDLAQFNDLTLKYTLWTDPKLGAPFESGEFRFSAADPKQGDSGMLWAGLITNTQLRAHNQVQQVPETINPILPEVNWILGTDRFQQSDAQDLFDRLLLSSGSPEMMVGLESQLYEFILTHPQEQEMLKKRLRIIYLPQTVYSFNPFISLSREGSDFADLIYSSGVKASPELFEIACARHGFRVSPSCVQKHSEVFDAWGMPENLPPSAGNMTVSNYDLILNSSKH